ncbi:MAG TPA: LysR family transcriptional regulator, partial [Cobetia sp.]|nr:LysR family transcriptional regulator [Cobetia sp.]
QFEACLPEWKGPSIPVSLHYPFGHPPRKLGALLDHIRRRVPTDWTR